MKVDFRTEEKKGFFKTKLILWVTVSFSEEEKHMILSNDLEKFHIHFEENDAINLNVRQFFNGPISIGSVSSQADIAYAKRRITADLQQLKNILDNISDQPDSVEF